MNLNGKVTNPGAMRVLVQLGTRAVAMQTGGFQVGMVNFTAFATVWARWVNVHGQEVWAAESANAVQAATVLIRWRADVNPACGVMKGADWYEIVSMDNIHERNEYIELKVRRVISN